MGDSLSLEYNNFINMDTGGIKDKEIILYWFIGRLFDTNVYNLYLKYGHLGFGIYGGNIYGFGAKSGKGYEIFNGNYFGKITRDNNIFELAKINNYEIKTLKVYVNQEVYEQIESWESGIIDYEQINSIIYGIHWNENLQMGIKKHNLPDKPIANCVSFLKFLSPVYKKNNQNIDNICNYELLSMFDKYIDKIIK